ncbi:MAG: hypothetical protein A2Y66_01410 [Nitrospirae bacterium RBG_13_41_22]|nr:MAG: hypothetical protein A2Y66_01410 [Nitrospirae bacterium RBG_13_41_22]
MNFEGANPKYDPYHMGIRGKVSRNTLANANQSRDCRIYADFAQVLIKFSIPAVSAAGRFIVDRNLILPV